MSHRYPPPACPPIPVAAAASAAALRPLASEASVSVAGPSDPPLLCVFSWLLSAGDKCWAFQLWKIRRILRLSAPYSRIANCHVVALAHIDQAQRAELR